MESDSLLGNGRRPDNLLPSSRHSQWKHIMLIGVIALAAITLTLIGVAYHKQWYPFTNRTFTHPTQLSQSSLLFQNATSPLSSSSYNSSYHSPSVLRQYSLLDQDPNFQEINVYFPQMFLISNPYSAPLDGIINGNNSTPGKPYNTVGGDNNTATERSVTSIASLADPQYRESRLKPQHGSQEVPQQGQLSPPTAISPSSPHTTVFQFYPGATELPLSIHLGLGYHWMPLKFSQRSKDEDHTLQHSIIHTVKYDGLKSLHLQFDGTSIYYPGHNDGGHPSQKEIEINRALLQQVQLTFRPVLFEAKKNNITPLITLHHFQSHRDQQQWNWLKKNSVQQFVHYAKAVFPFFVENGVERIITIHGWEDFCRRRYSLNPQDILTCHHHIYSAHTSTIIALREQCHEEELSPVFHFDYGSHSNHSNHSGHTKTTNKKPLISSVKFCSRLKFTLGLQSAFYISRSRGSGIAHIDYKRDYSTQTMTSIGRLEMSNPHPFQACSHQDANNYHSSGDCNPQQVAPTHANLVAIGNSINVLYKGDYAESYKRLMQHTLDNLPSHRYNNNATHQQQQQLPTFSSSQQSHLLKNQPDFIYLEYITSKYVYYDEGCLDLSRQYSHNHQQQKNKNKSHPALFDLSCLRYSNTDISGFPIGPHPSPTAHTNPSTNSSRSDIELRNQGIFDPIMSTRLVPRGLSLLLQYVSDLTYLIKHPHKTKPLSSQTTLQTPPYWDHSGPASVGTTQDNSNNHNNSHHNSKKADHLNEKSLRNENVPIVVSISITMSNPVNKYAHNAPLNVIINNNHHNPSSQNVHRQLFNASHLYDFYRVNALALLLTEVTMASNQRNINIISLLYTDFIDPSHHDSQSTSIVTTGIIHMTDQFTLSPKLSLLWLQSEATAQHQRLDALIAPSFAQMRADAAQKHPKIKKNKVKYDATEHGFDKPLVVKVINDSVEDEEDERHP